MSGARLEKTGGVPSGVRRGFSRAENDADASGSFAVCSALFAVREMAGTYLAGQDVADHTSGE